MRRIIHVDMDAFYASIEQFDHPELKGKPVIVGGDPTGRGVVSAASYEAREYGVQSAMPAAQAERLCPQAVFLPPRFERYTEVSQMIREIMLSYTPLVEPISLDEAFLDVTGAECLFGPAEEIGREIKLRIKEETGLTCSVGVAPNKFLAKLASDLGKPDGFMVIKGEDAEEFLKGLPISRLWGVGRVTERKLNEMGISIIGELQTASLEELVKRFGKAGKRLHHLARGIDESPVVPEQEAKSLSRETTFAEDITDRNVLKQVLLELSEEVGRKLREENKEGRTVQIKVRFADFTTITRSISLDYPTNLTETIWKQAESLFDQRVELRGRGVRLLGVGLSNLTPPEKKGQLPLFKEEELRPQDERLRKLDEVVDRLRNKFGKDVIKRGRSLE